MIKKIFFILTILSGSIGAWSQSVTVFESGGWLESAYLKWNPVAGTDSYNVYYTGEGITDKKIDNQLIRSYGSYFRADVLGLKAGSYTFKVAPVVASVEGVATTTGSITVLAHDRSGFAFSNGRIPGAYKADGTPKDNALILYITQNNKNTISLNVTGANANPCVGLQTILDGFKKGSDTRPLIVRLVGQITDFAYMLNGDIVIENKQNASSYITFEGVGDDAVADGWGIRIKTATNIEIRNIGSMNVNSSEGDNIGLQQDNSYIWVHNVDFFYGHAGSAADQLKGDGALDTKKSTFVSLSYNHFWDTGKSNLLGLSEGTTSGLYITYHHNWYDHSDSRHPRVRYYSAHVYNNYYDGISKYGVGSTEASSIFVENNYFRNAKYPMLTSMQGTDIFYGSPTFSSENGGNIKAFNNFITGQTRFVPYGDIGFPNATVEFDAYVVSSRNEVVPSTVKSKVGAYTYNNFDTNPAVMYAYTPDSPEEAKTKVMQYAGRMNGGDFKWTFNNAVDDTSSDVNAALKSALTTYRTSLVFVQGDAAASSQTLVVSTANASQTVTEGDAIQDIIFTWGGDATDATVSGLPASGIGFVKDLPSKTITISGTPTATLSYSISTTGTGGTPASGSGTLTMLPSGTAPSDEIHNFTQSGKTSTFFNITGNLSTGYGTAAYDGLTFTQCLKMESATSITFTTASSSTLTLVFGSSYTGRVKINGVNYTPSSGIVTVPLSAGTHTIAKTDTNYLFYMKIVYDATLGINDFSELSFKLYPNPVVHQLNIAAAENAVIEKVEIYNLMGMLVKSSKANVEFIDLSNLAKGRYLVRLYTEKGSFGKMIIKN